MTVDAIRIQHSPLVREPDGVRHALATGERRTLCGIPLTELIEFGNVGFTARSSQRCASCEPLARRAARPKQPASDRARSD